MNNMPEYPERIETIRTILKQQGQADKPSFRALTFAKDQLQRFGYMDDPAKVNAAAIDNLTFQQISDYYKQHIQGKPVTIIIMGDPKQINKKTMAGFGKFNSMSKSRIFKELDEDEL